MIFKAQLVSHQYKSTTCLRIYRRMNQKYEGMLLRQHTRRRRISKDNSRPKAKLRNFKRNPRSQPYLSTHHSDNPLAITVSGSSAASHTGVGDGFTSFRKDYTSW